ncbi:MAG: phage DNA encapsidation protein [Clostridia bacterium]|nr:phage DNA encapsidation protein [Clostridia bacterium]
MEKGALLNIVLSDRSDGKTFDCKMRALEDYRDHKMIHIYLRRYKSEITPITYQNFFNDVLSKECGKEFRQWKFRGNKYGVEVKTSENDEWNYIVYFVVLSMSGKLKSSIPNETKVCCIDYDEFIPLDNRYLKDEINILLEFYKTIDRDRDSLQLIILGNKLTPFNPLFDYFDIKLRIEKDKIRMYKDDTIAVQIYSNKEHREERSESKLSKLVKDTDYDSYNQGGILYDLGIVEGNHVGMDYWCSFKTSKGEGSIWYNTKGKFNISSNIRKDGFVLTDKIYNTGREEYTIKYGHFASTIKQLYRSNNLTFESDKTYYAFEDILTKSSAM